MSFFGKLRGAPAPTVAERAEAATIVADEISRLREKTYDELSSLRDTTLAGKTVRLASGLEVFTETWAYWDGKRDRDLRVAVRVWRAKTSGSMTPISQDDFVKAPSGEFIGE